MSNPNSKEILETICTALRGDASAKEKIDTFLSQIQKTAHFAIRHPVSAYCIGNGRNSSPKSLSNTAYRISELEDILNASPMDEGSERGAFRHALWQSMITSQFSPEIAEEAGNAHEYGKFYIPGKMRFDNIRHADEAVDQLNNQIGRSIGEKQASSSPKINATDVLNYFLEEGLYQAVPQEDGSFTIKQKKLDENKYWNIMHSLELRNDDGLSNDELYILDENPIDRFVRQYFCEDKR